MSLSEAREIFKRDYADVILKGRSIKTASDARPGTVGDLFKGYVKHLKSNDQPSWLQVEKGLDKIAHLLNRDRLARDITADDVLDVLRPIYARGKRAMADHVRSYIRSAYSWAIKSEHDYRRSSARRFKIVSNRAATLPDRCQGSDLASLSGNSGHGAIFGAQRSIAATICSE
jgi:hypothetical protein